MQSGFDCLGATDTTPSFSDFLKKEGVDVMADTAEQLKKSDAKTPASAPKKPTTSSKVSEVAPIVGGIGGIAAGAMLWTKHRVWGGLLGGVGGGLLGRVVGMFF